jgi:hypothetical protein
MYGCEGVFLVFGTFITPTDGVNGALDEAGTASWPETVRLIKPGLRTVLAELAFLLQNGRFS